MKIFEYSGKEMKKQKSLVDSLKIDLNYKMIISFVGGGGKTSLIYELGKELSRFGKKVIITTTTHMAMPESNVILTGKRDDIVKLLCDKDLITVGMLCGREDEKDQNQFEINSLNKITGLPKNMAETLIELSDFVLVEADGAKRLPLKVPDIHEPVILKGSKLVVGVCGIDALGKSIKETCHRVKLVSKFLNKDDKHIINECDVAKILCSTQGQKKNVECDYEVIINKADTIVELEKAVQVSKELLNLGMCKTIITTFKDEI